MISSFNIGLVLTIKRAKMNQIYRKRIDNFEN